MNLYDALQKKHLLENKLNRMKQTRILFFNHQNKSNLFETKNNSSIEILSEEIDKLTEQIDELSEQINLTTLLNKIYYDEEIEITLTRMYSILRYINQEIKTFQNFQLTLINSKEDTEFPMKIEEVSAKLTDLENKYSEYKKILLNYELDTELIKQSNLADFILNKE